MTRVSFIYPPAFHYRLPFHERVRARLAAHGIDYRVVYSAPAPDAALKRDTVSIDWGIEVPITRFGGKLAWQHAWRIARGSGLAIVQQENALLLNYALQLASLAGMRRVALFGHGRNFQSRRPDGLAERWKRWWATRADWWFAYTDETRRHVESLGFPRERITVFNNAIDTSALAADLAAVSDAEAAAARTAAGLGDGPVGLFVGGLYQDKRLDFLVEAAERVREAVPGFQLLVIGGGESLPQLQELARTRPWLALAGPRFGRDKAALMRSAEVLLMPGLVGLAVLDAAVAGLPMVTTAWPWHSPEIAYLEDGVNGEIVQDWRSVEAYAEAVTRLLQDPAERAKLARGARAVAEDYTIEAMAERFSEGVMGALAR